MTDRELLECAAKAAGLALEGWSNVWRGGDFGAFHMNDGLWNPLIDDGDALRLAVKLRISPNQGVQCVDVIHMRKVDYLQLSEYFADESGRLAATRRAIVALAAQIGKEK